MSRNQRRAIPTYPDPKSPVIPRVCMHASKLREAKDAYGDRCVCVAVPSHSQIMASLRVALRTYMQDRCLISKA